MGLDNTSITVEDRPLTSIWWGVRGLVLFRRTKIEESRPKWRYQKLSKYKRYPAISFNLSDLPLPLLSHNIFFFNSTMYLLYAHLFVYAYIYITFSYLLLYNVKTERSVETLLYIQRGSARQTYGTYCSSSIKGPKQIYRNSLAILEITSFGENMSLRIIYNFMFEFISKTDPIN